MKDISVPTRAIIPLLQKFAVKELGKEKANKSDVSELGRRISGKGKKDGDQVLMNDGNEFPFSGNNRYLENLYGLTEKDDREVRNVDQEYINSISRHLGYIDIQDYLIKEKYVDPETNVQIQPKSIDQLLSRNPPYPNEWIDKYILGARFIPSLVALICLPTTFVILTLDKKDIPNIILLVILLIYISIAYVISGWNSIKGKEYQEKYFFTKGKNGLPTVYLMLYNEESKYSNNQKLEYREKVKAYFGLDLKSKKEESEDIISAIQLLNEAGIKVKDAVKSNIIRSSNIRYGLIRNLVPATLLGSVLSILSLGIGLFLNDQLTLITFSILAIILFMVHLQLRYGKTLRQAAEAYATYLLDEFLSR